jgi:hypothetical protein
MTQQYQEESINGQPGAQSLVVVPSAPAVPGGVNTEAAFWPTLAGDATIVGDAISIVGNAALGTIIQFAQPGVFSMQFVTANLGFAAPTPVNILRGVPLGTLIVAPTYPSLDFVGVPSPGVEAVDFFTAAAPENVALNTTFRILTDDLVDPAGAVNPNRQVLISAAAVDIPGFAPPGTRILVQRVSL